MFNFLQTRGAAKPGMAVQDIVTKAGSGEMTVIDVRDSNELAQTGIAKGALHIPLSVLQFRTDPRNPDFHPELKTDKPVAIYCATGARSGMAARVMGQMGFGDVSNLVNLNNWVAGGGEVVRN